MRESALIMTITYTIGNSLYINITNRCTNNCDFCIRNNEDGVGDANNLWLKREPTKEEIWEDINRRDLSIFKEIVFCGYGEPTLRLFDMLFVCEKIKKAHPINIRINTNGQANLIYKKNITSSFLGLVDSISISLNAKNSEDYINICHPIYGDKTYEAILEFAKECRKYVKEVIFTVVDTMPKEDIEICKNIANEIGINFRVRELI